MRERGTFIEVNQTAANYTVNKHIAERNTLSLRLRLVQLVMEK